MAGSTAPLPGSLAYVIEALFHIATRADWLAAQQSGQYTTSTRGRTLAQEGFIHAASRGQVPGVFKRHYADADEPLVLLQVDPRQVEADIRLEKVGNDRFPHIYGPIPAAAVLSAIPLDAKGGTDSFSAIFLREMLTRVALAFVAMLCAFAGAGIADGQWGRSAQLAGALVGLAVGIGLAVLIWRRLERRV